MPLTTSFSTRGTLLLYGGGAFLSSVGIFCMFLRGGEGERVVGGEGVRSGLGGSRRCVHHTLVRTRTTFSRSRVPMNTIVIYESHVVSETRGLARVLASIATRTRVRTVASKTGVLNKGCLGSYALCIAMRPYIVYTKTLK